MGPSLLFISGCSVIFDWVTLIHGYLETKNLEDEQKDSPVEELNSGSELQKKVTDLIREVNGEKILWVFYLNGINETDFQ